MNSSGLTGRDTTMPQSLSRILIHLVFSTKHRVRILDSKIRSELHPYLAAVLTNNDCPSLRVGGVEDHVHLFFGLSRTLTVAQVVETIKTSSSKWIKTKGSEFSQFHWQGGYGAFSVSESVAKEVIHYIMNQEEHHRRRTFQEEFREFLKRHNVAYDERYVWD
jgi:REP element-mobilizing transposase RayT